MVFEYYRILKSKREDIDYLADDMWESVKRPNDILEKGMEKHDLCFIGRLNDEYENVESNSQ